MPAPAYYPVYLDLRGRRVVLIGGNFNAVKKVRGLLVCEPKLVVIAPELEDEIREHADAGRLTWVKRGYQPGDLEGAFVAMVADTSDEAVNQAVYREAQERNVTVNVEDVTHLCMFIAPSVVRRGDVAVAVSTGGASPALARKFRETLSGSSPLKMRHSIMEYSDIAPLLSEVRLEMKRQGQAVSNEHWQACLTDELVDMVQAGRTDEARRALTERLEAGMGCDCAEGTCRMWDEMVVQSQNGRRG
ncbi:MAG: bifunctional precorrin-2 dehydrogenase/sirohydrochlorin ferrochelatase [Chloroflexi bacterium]|nr:bifunctional precorrin-2 dehydrogenase/sirohydrochlorin ferrochelatase [Chloroflexota bacterium]